MSEKRDFNRKRKTNLRDSKLILIATEGTYTEKKYLDGLSQEYHNSRIIVHVIEAVDTRSAPSYIVEALDKFKKDYKVRKDDDCFVVIDFDRWGEPKLAEVQQQCRQKNYELIVSRPAFEFWLLLHIKDIDEYSDEEKTLILENRRTGTRTHTERKIIEITGRYNKTHPHLEDFIPYIEVAIGRAKHLEQNGSSPWPNNLGSRVFIIAEIILNN